MRYIHVTCYQAFKCDQGSWEGLESLIKGLPGLPDAVISNAALGSATVEQYEPDPHKQDLAMLQVSMTAQFLPTRPSPTTPVTSLLPSLQLTQPQCAQVLTWTTNMSESHPHALQCSGHAPACCECCKYAYCMQPSSVHAAMQGTSSYALQQPSLCDSR